LINGLCSGTGSSQFQATFTERCSVARRIHAKFLLLHMPANSQREQAGMGFLQQKPGLSLPGKFASLPESLQLEHIQVLRHRHQPVEGGARLSNEAVQVLRNVIVNERQATHSSLSGY